MGSLKFAILVFTATNLSKNACSGVVNVIKSIGPVTIWSSFMSVIFNLYSVLPFIPSLSVAEIIFEELFSDGVDCGLSSHGLTTTPEETVICNTP